MEIFILFSNILCLTLINFIQDGQGDNFPPLVLSVKHNYFELDALEMVKENAMALNPNAELTAIPVAVLCCPATTIAELNFNRKIKNENLYCVINNVVYNIDNNFAEIESLCKVRYLPSVYMSQTSVEEVIISYSGINYFLYQIGYKVCDYKNIVVGNQLPEWKNKCDIFSNLEILFNKDEVKTKLVKYKLYRSIESGRKMDKCYDYSVGKEKNELQEVIEMAYSESWQNILLDNALFIEEEISSPSEEKQIPTRFIKPSEGTRIGIDQYTNVTKWFVRSEQPVEKRDFLIPQLLAPEQHFRDESLTLPVCSYLNTAPMWNSIAEGAWRNVQRFVQKVADRVNPLSVIIALHDPLTVHFFGRDGGVQERKLYLLPDKTIPVPEAFLTVVMYHIPAYRDLAALDYGMILVTGNKLFIPIDEICDTVKCETVGWHGVNVGVQGPPTYCCRFTEKNINKLGIKVSRTSQFEGHDFNLRIVAKGRQDGGSIAVVSYADGLFNEMMREEMMEID